MYTILNDYMTSQSSWNTKWEWGASGAALRECLASFGCIFWRGGDSRRRGSQSSGTFTASWSAIGCTKVTFFFFFLNLIFFFLKKNLMYPLIFHSNKGEVTIVTFIVIIIITFTASWSAIGCTKVTFLFFLFFLKKKNLIYPLIFHSNKGDYNYQSSGTFTASWSAIGCIKVSRINQTI